MVGGVPIRMTSSIFNIASILLIRSQQPTVTRAGDHLLPFTIDYSGENFPFQKRLSVSSLILQSVVPKEQLSSLHLISRLVTVIKLANKRLKTHEIGWLYYGCWL
ncbi:hypothetical protein Y032_0168g188 [Ancylostoma ceylanicum]|uniref:Uncharacterized protein n=1 Tax=Ancylostoma ceylanicum TaxID=53326 RepID=A0A016SW18_9BILA|nr:hypothetical protein Y032_0168g188 [Ancylostoma ceylanicum]